MLTVEQLEMRCLCDAAPCVAYTPIVLASGRLALVIQGAALAPQQVAQVGAWNEVAVPAGAPPVLLGLPSDYRPAPHDLIPATPPGVVK